MDLAIIDGYVEQNPSAISNPPKLEDIIRYKEKREEIARDRERVEALLKEYRNKRPNDLTLVVER